MVKLVGDLNDPSIYDKIVKHALDTFGRIDILINNAGIVVRDDILTVEEKTFANVINTNLKSILFLTKACQPQLIQNKGSFLSQKSY